MNTFLHNTLHVYKKKNDLFPILWPSVEKNVTTNGDLKNSFHDRALTLQSSKSFLSTENSLNQWQMAKFLKITFWKGRQFIWKEFVAENIVH